MADIAKLMKKLGYPTDEKGVCVGLALMAERARACNEYDKFKKRMEYLKYLQQIRQRLEEAKAQFKVGGLFVLTEKQKILIEIEAFFSQIWLYQNPAAMQRFLDLQGPYLCQGNAAPMEDLIYDKDSDIGSMPLSLPYHYFLSINNMFDPLSSFLDSIQQSNVSLGFTISNFGHVVHLFFKNNIWHLTNHSSLTEYKSSDQLIIELKNILNKNSMPVTSLSVQLFTREQSDNKTQLLQKLTQISNNSVNIIAQDDYINCPGHNEVTALYVACRYGHLDTVVILLQNPTIDINQAPHATGWTALYIACQNGYLDIVRALLENDNIEVNKASNIGSTALYIACKCGHLDVVKTLLENDEISVNQARNNGMTPLYIACQCGYSSIVRELLLHNPNINSGSQASNQILIDNARQKGDEYKERVASLIAGKSLINFTPLHAAVFFGHVEIVKQLLAKGADINLEAAPGSGLTALELAKAMNHGEIINVLDQHKIPNIIPPTNDEMNDEELFASPLNLFSGELKRKVEDETIFHPPKIKCASNTSY